VTQVKATRCMLSDPGAWPTEYTDHAGCSKDLYVVRADRSSTCGC